MKSESTSMVGPPPINWAQIDCTAKLDYIKVASKKKRVLPVLSGTHNWNPIGRGHTGFTLTVQDPKLPDINTLIDNMDDPMLMSFQLTVDLQPKATFSESDREALLLETFRAVAGRFRPEDEALWAYGLRGGTDGVGKAPKPFHRRFPEPNEELVYGQRGGWMQSTVYLKRTNEGDDLDHAEHCIRMELTLVRGGVMEIGLDRLSGLCGFAYRPVFTKHFRIVAEPRIRAARTRSAADLKKMTTKMQRAWATAGVGKFGVSQAFRPDTLVTSISRIAARERQQLPMRDHVLLRDQEATKIIGNALRQLQRRMTLKKSRAV